jgi:hypothetical protein
MFYWSCSYAELYKGEEGNKGKDTKEVQKYLF